MWGYTAREVPRFKIKTKTFKVRLYRQLKRSVPMAKKFRFGLNGAVLPCADIRDTSFIGSLKRILSMPPTIDSQLFNEFMSFVDSFISELPILMEPPKFEEWILTVNQPESRKEEYRRSYETYLTKKIHFDKLAQIYGTDEYVKDTEFEKFLRIASFIKSEWYLEIKPNRGINPRSLEYMPVVGPAYAEISKIIFQMPEFIKYVPIGERAKYIFDRLSNAGSRCVQTDYKSFENSFTRQIQEAVEMKLYKHFLKKFPDVYNLCHAQCVSNNICSDCCSIKMDAARMSGEMCTSLGNGFTNLMLMKFFCYKHCITDAVGVIEGDDGLFTYHGPSLTNDFFNRLGFSIEISEFDLNEASFCGNIFTEESFSTLADPIEVMATASYSMQAVGARPSETNKLNYLMGFSLLCQYGNCPIIGSFARMQIRNAIMCDPKVHQRAIAYSKTSRKLCWWDREVLSQCIQAKVFNDKINFSDRLLVEKLFLIPISAQLLIEKELEQCKGSYSSPIIDYFVENLHPDWKTNYSNVEYCNSVPVRYLKYTPLVDRLSYKEGEELEVYYEKFYAR